MPNLLEKLSNARGVSGDECQVRDQIVQAIESRVDEYRVDSMGNLIAYKRASAPAKRRGALRVMIAAHMDEVGLIIDHIQEDGRLHFAKVGSIDDRILASKVFLIGNNQVPGVIGSKPVHLIKPGEMDKALRLEELRLDIGARSKDEALGVIKLGDYATFDAAFVPFGDGLVRGKALDDRTGCALLVELLGADYPVDLYAVFTVQEEIGTRGARVVGSTVNPDAVFVLESTVCDDGPKEKDVSPTTRLGMGPALTVADKSMIADKRLVALLTETASDNEIPLQTKQPLIGGTDAGGLQRSGEGVPSAVLSVPTRYIHSPFSVLSIGDYEKTRLLMQMALPQVVRALHS